MSDETSRSESVSAFAYDQATNSITEVAPRRVVRIPLRYARPFGTDLNHERLPASKELEGMQLSFREDSIPIESMSEHASQWITSIVCITGLISLVFGVGYPLLRPLVFKYGFLFLGAAAYIAVAIVIGARKFTLHRFLLLIAMPLIVAAVATTLFLLLEFRVAMSVFFAIASTFLLLTLGDQMHDFYKEWLLCAPHLTPEDQQDLRERWGRVTDTRPKQQMCYAQRHRGKGRPSDTLSTRQSIPHVPIFLFTIPIVIFIPMASCSAAIVLAFTVILIGIAISFFLSPVRKPIRTAYRQFLRVLGVYFLYGKVTSGAPGIWRPRVRHGKRVALLLASTVVVSVFFAVALEGVCPWELWLGRNIDQQPGIFARHISHAWVLTAVDLVMEGRFEYIWMFFCSIVLSVAAILLFLFEFFFSMAIDLRHREEIVESYQSTERPRWQWYVDRIRQSDHRSTDPVLGKPILERSHLFFGIEPNAKHPVLFDRKILSEHVHITGESGSGKTSLGLMPILIQLLRGGEDAPHPGFDPASSDTLQSSADPRPPIVVIDLKGDPALFHTVRAEAEFRSKGSFRWFTPEPNFSSHYFNPFVSLASDSRSLAQVCELLLESLSLSHGEGYGRSYFTRENRAAILAALKHDPQPRSFAELYSAVLENAKENPKKYEDVGEVISTLQMLAEYPQVSLFKPLKNPADAIHMPSVLEKSQVVYFWLPAALESVSVREIGKLALYSLLSSAIDRQRSGQRVKQCYLVIDEFQRIVGENFKIILEQARSFGVGAILANQTAADLDTPSGDLRPTVNTNTRAKMIFSVSDPNEIRSLQDLSGEEIVESESQQLQEPLSDSKQSIGLVQEFVKSRLSTTDVLAVNDHPQDFFLQVSRGSGYTQYGGLPIRVRATWPISESLYQHRLSDEEWPVLNEYELEEGTIVSSDQTPAEIDRKREAWSKTFDDKLRQVFERYQNSPDDLDT